jgi:hypothetical protein
MIDIESIVIFACMTIFSLVLLTASLLSYHRYKKPKLLFIGGVFLLFLVRSILLSMSIFYEPLQALTSSVYIWLFDVLLLIMLYLTSLKR